MRYYRNQVLLVFFLGAVLPLLLVTIVSRGDHQPTEGATTFGTEEVQPTVTTSVYSGDFYISVLMEDASIEQLELDEYLTAVVLMEMPAEFETEALKAQAVVARTYAMKRYFSGGKHTGAAVCTDSACCQGYCHPRVYLEKGGTEADIERVRQAVSETEDLVLTYDGSLIDATYFSCSGGMTESALAVWGADIPYLQAITSPGEERAAHYTDTVTFTAEEFSSLLGASLSGHPETWIESLTYTTGGGVETIRICGTDYGGTALRKLLGLRSTAFTITALGNTITVTTKGYGHRVGMSQYGADAMAVNGSAYDEILAYYYRGTILEHLNN